MNTSGSLERSGRRDETARGGGGGENRVWGRTVASYGGKHKPAFFHGCQWRVDKGLTKVGRVKAEPFRAHQKCAKKL